MAKRSPTITTRLDTMCRRWAARNDIPNGWRLAFRRSDGRLVRGDMKIHRHRLPERHDNVQISDAIREIVDQAVTDLTARGISGCVLDPAGNSVRPTNSMKWLRARPPIPTNEDIEAETAREEERERIAQFLEDLDIVEEIDDAAEVYLRSVIRHLRRRGFSKKQIEKALAEEK